MVTTTIFDLNGVFTTGPKLSIRIHETYHIPMEQILTALEEVKKISRKKNAPRFYACWKPFFQDWKIEIDESEFMELWLGAETIVPEMIYVVKNLKSSGFKVYVLANDYRERAAFRQKRIPSIDQILEDICDGVYVSWKTGYVKPDEKAFSHVLRINNLNVSECLYFDDSGKNVDVARTLGMEGYVVESCDEIKDVLSGKGLLVTMDSAE